ncbi:hypothetical protein ACFWIZ_02325 [Streptomyces sp. NPDC127044]
MTRLHAPPRHAHYASANKLRDVLHRLLLRLMVALVSLGTMVATMTARAAPVSLAWILAPAWRTADGGDHSRTPSVPE